LSFIVGVSSSLSGSQSWGRVAKRLICAMRESVVLARSTASLTSSLEPLVCGERRDRAVELTLARKRCRRVRVEHDQRDVVGAPITDAHALAEPRQHRRTIGRRPFRPVKQS
jgi:hypothetical protein